MALTPSGAISMSDINTALNRSSTTAISFNDNGPRCIANADTGSVSMSAMRGKQVASGTVTVGVSSATNKGVTTDYYGLREAVGSATLGNLTTVPYFAPATSFSSLYGSDPRNSALFGGVFNVVQTSQPTTAPSFRVKVGGNTSTAFTFSTFVGNTAIFSAGTSLTSAFIGSADASTTRTWVLST